MKSCCLEYKCTKCCLETSMPLADLDIEHIKSLGFNANFFVAEHDGWLQLKNKDGRCVFHNGKICSIYKDRPDGCKLYPIIYDKDINSAIFDKDCPHKDKFQMSKITVRQLYRIVSILESERVKRTKNTK